MMTPDRKPPDTSTYSGRFAVRLRMLREKAGLTPEQVAEAVGVTVTTLYDWEASRKIPVLEKFPKISEALKLNTTRSLLPNE